jgi:hypothetical protein
MRSLGQNPTEPELQGMINESATKQIRPGSRHARQVFRSLNPPLDGDVKINVDVALARYDDHGVVAAICRRSDGVYLGSLALDCPGFSEPAILETIAYKEGLAPDLQETRCVITSDCQEVITAKRHDCHPAGNKILE